MRFGDQPARLHDTQEIETNIPSMLSPIEQIKNIAEESKLSPKGQNKPSPKTNSKKPVWFNFQNSDSEISQSLIV